MMTDMEAREVARIVSKADGGCPYCVKDLVTELEVSFPEFQWKALVKLFYNGEPF